MGPRRKAYLEIEDDPDAEFEMYLAEKLRKTLGEIREIPNAEYIRWYVWFGRKAQQQELANKQGG